MVVVGMPNADKAQCLLKPPAHNFNPASFHVLRLTLKVLGKKESCDTGTIESPKATVVTYVEQEPEFKEGWTVLDAVFGADNPLMR